MPELRFQATPRQWVLIAVLCTVLAGVLFYGEPADTDVEAPISLAVTPKQRAALTSTARTAGTTPRLPQFTADEVAKFNPFGRPDIAREQPNESAAAASESPAAVDLEALRKLERERALADLRSKGVRFVIGDQSGAAALLGNQQIRTGEIVRGFRVIRIDQSGVVLEPAE